MSRLFDKLFSKLLAVIVIVLFIVGFREMILTDEDTYTAFAALMGMLPFAEVLSEVVCNILKYQYEIPIISTSSVIIDLLKLAVMACLQPLVVGILTAIFLPVPGSLRDYALREEYMSSFSYRAKELVITVISAPILALTAAWFTSWLFNYFTTTFGNVLSVVMGLLSVVLLSAASLIPLLIAGVTVGTAIAWRLLVTLGSKMVTTLVTNALCLAVYVALLGGIEGQVATTIVSLIVWLIIMDFGVNCLQKAVVG